MSEVHEFVLEDESGNPITILIEAKSQLEIADPERGIAQRPGGMGLVQDTAAKLQDARGMIRGYTKYALSAFQDFKGVKIEEVNLKFGLKLAGKTGLPCITEGSAESNLEISVKCRFPTD